MTDPTHFSPVNPDRKPLGWELALLFGLPFILYAHTYGYGLTNYDDNYYYFLNTTIKPPTFNSLIQVWLHPFFSDYIPLTHWTYWLDLKLFGDQSWWGPRLHNLFWFGLSTLALRSFIARLTGRASTGFWVALLFCVHPIGTQSIVWLAERKNNLVLTFILLCMERYIAARTAADSKNARNAGLLAGLFGALALFSKAHALALAPMILFWECCYGNGSWLKRAAWISPYVIGAALYVGINLPQRSDLGGHLLGGTRFNAVLSDGPILLDYFWHTVCPFNLAMLYPVHEYGPAHWQGWVAWLVLTALAFGCVYAHAEKRLMVFAWLLGFAALSPALNLVPQALPSFDHWNHHALPAWLLVFVLLGEEIGKRIASITAPNFRVVLASSIALLFAYLSFQHAPDYQSKMILFSSSVTRYPDSAPALSLLAAEFMESTDPELRKMAGPASLKALECADENWIYQQNRGLVAREAAIELYARGKRAEAAELLEREIKKFAHQDGVLPALTRAEVANRIGEYATALEVLKPWYTTQTQEVAAQLRARCRTGAQLPSQIEPIPTGPNNSGFVVGHESELFQQKIWEGMLTQLAFAALKSGQKELAFDAAAILVNNAPENPGAKKLLAQVYIELGVPDAAARLTAK